MALQIHSYGGVVALGYDSATGERGFLTKAINRTGHSSIKGEIISRSSTADREVVLQSTEYDAVGVVAEAGVAEGVEMWVVTEGKAECLVVATCTAGQLARGFVTGDAGYVKGSLLCESVPTSPFATDKHFYEFGHVNTGRTGAGLAMIQIHKN